MCVYSYTSNKLCFYCFLVLFYLTRLKNYKIFIVEVNKILLETNSLESVTGHENIYA